MKNWKKVVLGTIGTGIGIAVATWLDNRKKTEAVEFDEEVTEAEIVDVSAEESEEVSEEVVEG